ncbi:hypothetical protein PS712_05782 [Pseudomonas fluorescens]|uniref:Uncharacterized protein n=1 Tax=Pseudomonas fluorescens TaxID=294 RepID=A0A5E7FN02_PSEFL|nr:hypothetical protein PS712_05782 [Pseudomonas fluorescens]
MSKVRKPNNGFARAERACRALLNTNHVAVVNIDPSGAQIMANWKSCKQIRSLAIANALFDFSYRWTIYISAMCRDERGVEYVKSVEISPEGIYKVERLTDAIEHYYLELRESCNPNHLVGIRLDRRSRRDHARRSPGREAVLCRRGLASGEGRGMRRVSNQVRQRRRQTWLDLPAHGIEEAGHGQEQCRSLSESRGEEEGTRRRGNQAALPARYSPSPC